MAESLGRITLQILRRTLIPVNQPEEIDQSDTFLPITELAYKTVIYLLNWLNKQKLKYHKLLYTD